MERHMIEPDIVSNDSNSNETEKPKKHGLANVLGDSYPS